MTAKPSVAPDDEALIIQRLRNIAFDLNTSMLDDVTEALRRRLAELVSDLADARKALAECRSATIEECAAIATARRNQWSCAGGFGGHFAGARIIQDEILALKTKEPKHG